MLFGEEMSPSARGREVERYERLGDGRVRCAVCPRRCLVAPGERGVCRVRYNDGGRFELLTYGKAVSTAIDPIEKKPLFHFAPGARVLSVAARGCNFECDFCQNYRIAIEHDDVPEQSLPPSELAETAVERSCGGIAYTYTEPTIFLEYALDTMRETGEDTCNVFVSNGYMTEETATQLAPELDAINIDIKGDTEFYRKRCGVPDPAPIYDAAETLADGGVHVEITNLVIPEENDDPETVRERMAWIRKELGPETPVHFSRFRPAYRMQDVPPTPIGTLESLMDVAREEGLQYVYCGNVPGHESESTYCPDCGTLVIKRQGFEIRSYDLENGNCPSCGRSIDVAGTEWARGTESTGRRRRLGF